jgi:hypothetical protein
VSQCEKALVKGEWVRRHPYSAGTGCSRHQTPIANAKETPASVCFGYSSWFTATMSSRFTNIDMTADPACAPKSAFPDYLAHQRLLASA